VSEVRSTILLGTEIDVRNSIDVGTIRSRFFAFQQRWYCFPLSWYTHAFSLLIALPLTAGYAPLRIYEEVFVCQDKC